MTSLAADGSEFARYVGHTLVSQKAVGANPRRLRLEVQAR